MEWAASLRAAHTTGRSRRERAGTKRSKGFSRHLGARCDLAGGNVSHADENRSFRDRSPTRSLTSSDQRPSPDRRDPVRGENYAQAKITSGAWGSISLAGEGVRLIKLVDIHKSFGDRNVLDGSLPTSPKARRWSSSATRERENRSPSSTSSGCSSPTAERSGRRTRSPLLTRPELYALRSKIGYGLSVCGRCSIRSRSATTSAMGLRRRGNTRRRRFRRRHGSAEALDLPGVEAKSPPSSPGERKRVGHRTRDRAPPEYILYESRPRLDPVTMR